MMKHILVSIGLMFLCTQAVAMGDLKKAKDEITNGKTQLVDTVAQLKKAYADQKSGILDQIAKASPEIASYKGMLEDAYPASEAVRVSLITALPIFPLTVIATPALALAGDVPDLIRSLKATVDAIHTTLTTIDGNIRPKIEYLNPDADSRGIYKQGAVAIQAFADVESKLEKIMSALQKVAAGIRGKPTVKRTMIEEEPEEEVKN